MCDLKECISRIPMCDRVTIAEEIFTQVESSVILEMLMLKVCGKIGEILKFMSPKDMETLAFELFSQQSEELGKDAARFSQTYKDIGVLKDLDTEAFLERRNPVVVAAVQGLAGDKQNTFKQCLAVEHLYSLSGSSLVAPFSFLTNIVLLTVSNSKLAVNLFGKSLPGGSYQTLRTWLEQLSSESKPFPSGDCVVAIDNDQVVKKKWKIKVGQKSRVSIVTSVCQAQINPDGKMQQREDLAPRSVV